jgi:rfaE bifunctional protein kinase chain/domain
MDLHRLNQIVDRFPDMRVVVLGDFFLDKYMITDPAIAERSIETGLEARQVVEIRCSPGAAGTVTNNLSALGIGRIDALGVIGDDGQGYELMRGLHATRVSTDLLIQEPSRFTPTYTKPMKRTPAGEVEMERLDIKNRAALPEEIENELIARLTRIVRHSGAHRTEDGADAIIVLDQVEERNCGVVTDRVRETLAQLGAERPEVPIFADSRVRIGEFRTVLIKPNQFEAARAELGDDVTEVPREVGERCGVAMAKRNERAVFVTLGPEGILVSEPGGEVAHAPARKVAGPIDICGAGDSTTAGIVSALCSGASHAEAAFVGNLCASVTIRKIGTTGTASPDELREALVG